MYDMLLDLLDERGITDKFLDELVDFATVYEQQHYVKFLDNLKGFCSSDWVNPYLCHQQETLFILC